MAPRIAPSSRPHGAQRMLSTTTLTVEALVVLFAALVAHQLQPDQRTLTWALALVTAALLLATAGTLRRGGSRGYVIGLVLQVPVLLLGLVVPAMWILGAGFAALYVYGVLQGNRWDAEKDEVDRRVLAERTAETPEGGDEDSR